MLKDTKINSNFTNMEYAIKSCSELTLVGIDMRTSYKNSIQDIPKFWEKFNQEELIDTITEKQSNDVYAVYYNYENDFKGSYNFFIGYIVNDCNRSTPFKILKIPTQKYAVFSVKGDFPKSLIDTWEEIWESDIKRKYTFDFEKYHNNSNEKLEVYIAIK